MNKLTFLKQHARRQGYVIDADNALIGFKSFFKVNNLTVNLYYGKIWEVAVCYILGVMQQSMHERGKYMFISADDTFDAMQIDLEINKRPIQLKLFFSEQDVSTLQDILRFRNISVINATKYDCGIDIFRKLLLAAGYTEYEIDEEVDTNPGFDAAEDIWDFLIKTVFIE